MANKLKSTLKTFFQTGDIPSEGNYVDLIDSQYNLEETGVQISKGTFSGSAVLETLTVKDSFANLGIASFTLPITASNTAHISASGNTILTNVSASNYTIKSGSGIYVPSVTYNTVLDSIVVGPGTTSVAGGLIYSANKHQYTNGRVIIGGTDNFNGTPTLNVDGTIATDSHITASGNISASGDTIANDFIADLSSGNGYFFRGHGKPILNQNNIGGAIRLGANHPSVNHSGIELYTTGSSTRGLFLDGNGNMNLSGDISGSNISSSGTVFANALEVDQNVNISGQRIVYDSAGGNLKIEDSGLWVAGGHITASSDISASGTIYANRITAADQIAVGGNVITSDQANQLNNIGSTTVNSTQWGYLGNMNQDVTTTSNVGFDSITYHNLQTSAVAWSSDKFTLPNAFTHQITFTDIPELLPTKSVGGFQLFCGRIQASSIITVTTVAPSNLQFFVNSVGTGTATVTVFNPTSSTISTGDAAINLQIYGTQA